MAVLTLKSEEFHTTFPEILKNYAGYMVTIKGTSEKTVCEYLLDLRTFFRYQKLQSSISPRKSEISREEMESISITDLTLDDVKRVTRSTIINFLVHTTFVMNNSATTRMRKLSSLRSFFKYLHSHERLIDFNPTSDVDAPKKGKKLPMHLTFEQALMLLDSVDEDMESKTRLRDYAMITLFLNTGMRLSELVGLNLESLDPELKSLKVVGKGNKERIIYLNDASKSAVLNYLRLRTDPRYITSSEHALFISGREQRISNKTVQHVVYKYLHRSGVYQKGMSVHKLRHTAATLMYQSGQVDIRVLQEVLGHEQLNTTQIYTHIVNKNLEDAVVHNPLSEIKIK